GADRRRSGTANRPCSPAFRFVLGSDRGYFPPNGGGELSRSCKVARAMNNKIARFLSEHSPETPCLVVDLDLIAQAYDLLSRYLSVASVYYAVKANPAPEIVAMLAKKGADFAVASPAAIPLGLDSGDAADRVSLG